MQSIRPDSLLKLKHIIGDRKAGIAPIIPVCRATWYSGLKSGRYPQPVKLGARAVAWRGRDILAVVDGTWAPEQPAA